jgi:hypothetical protein
VTLLLKNPLLGRDPADRIRLAMLGESPPENSEAAPPAGDLVVPACR